MTVDIDGLQIPSRRSPVPQMLADGTVVGGWWIFARPRGLPIADVSHFRGVPSVVGSFSFADPFGPKDISITWPAISMFEALGRGDLYWLREKVSIDVVWADALPLAYPFGRYAGPRDARVWVPSFAWEGRITSFSYDTEGRPGLTASGNGAMYQLDDYLAKPEFLARPMPYEWAISRQFLEKPHLRLGRMHVEWPEGWGRTYEPKKDPWYMIPIGVRKGENWTGLLTRSTGSWDPVLTSYIQTLLSGMYTQNGRFTLDLARGRHPVLRLLKMLSRPNSSTVIIDPVDEGHQISDLQVDWTQALDVVYGQGTSLTGIAYSGLEVSSDGSRSFYTPLAARRQAYPAEDNDWLDLADSPREVLLQMQQGLSEYDAMKVAQAHLERFGDPGVTGTVKLRTDVKLNDGLGTVLPHHLVRAGMPVQIPGLLGRKEGVLAHVVESSADLVNKETTLTLDSKYRDALTVREARVRGRDSLNISRMLIAGQYNPPLPDMLKPWDYSRSGFIPSAPLRNGPELWAGMPNDMLFPWTEMTTARPPKKARWRHCYIRIGPAQDDANKNWGVAPMKPGGGKYAVGVMMAQAGTIRLLQIAAYDRDGNVMKVPFHVSFYYSNGVNVKAMPRIPAYSTDATHPATYYPYHHPPYDPGQHYPYVVNAWEQYNADGTIKSNEYGTVKASALLWKAFGTNFVKAGYFPGDGLSGDPTGLLVVENVGDFNCEGQQGPGSFDPRSPKGNLTNPLAGMMYVMIYCDEQGDEPVFFHGRAFHVEPGSVVGSN